MASRMVSTVEVKRKEKSMVTAPRSWSGSGELLFSVLVGSRTTAAIQVQGIAPPRRHDGRCTTGRPEVQPLYPIDKSPILGCVVGPPVCVMCVYRQRSIAGGGVCVYKADSTAAAVT